jgi:hypothetical protein
MSPGRILVLLSLVCFILTAFGLGIIGGVALLPLGLAFYVGSGLV